MVQTTVEHM